MLPEGDSVSSYHIFIQLSHHRLCLKKTKGRREGEKISMHSTRLAFRNPHRNPDYVILTLIFTGLSMKPQPEESISILRISHKDKFRRSQPAFLLFLFLFFLRAATQLLFHPCCLDIDSRDVIPGVSCVTEQRNCTPVLLYWSF
jgi:hypothetical protein